VVQSGWNLPTSLKWSRRFKSANISAVKSASKSTFMAHQILANTAASVTELKRDPMGTVAAGEGMPVVILNRNEPAFYCIPAEAYERLMDLVEDMELAAIAEARKHETPLKVNLEDL
jgi:antitoxin StbD